MMQTNLERNADFVNKASAFHLTNYDEECETVNSFDSGLIRGIKWLAVSRTAEESNSNRYAYFGALQVIVMYCTLKVSRIDHKALTIEYGTFASASVIAQRNTHIDVNRKRRDGSTQRIVGHLTFECTKLQ